MSRYSYAPSKEMRGLNISNNQHSNVPRNLRHEILTIPFTSQFAFGGYGILDFKEKMLESIN